MQVILAQQLCLPVDRPFLIGRHLENILRNFFEVGYLPGIQA